MGIEHLKRWHWMIVGLLVGAAFAFVWSQSAGDVTQQDRDSREPTEFARLLPLKRDDGTHVLNTIRVGPAHESYRGQAQIVYFNEWRQNPKTKEWLNTGPWFILAEQPFNRNLKNLPPDQNTVEHYLDQAREKDPTITYAGTWNKNPYTLYGTFALGGLVLIGVVWPTLMGVMANAGYGRKVEPKPAEVDLSKVRSNTGAKEHKAVIDTTDDDAELAAMNARLEAGLGEMALTDQPEVDDDDLPATRPQRPAVPQPLAQDKPEEPRPLTAAEQEAKEFGGEFYPVARPHVHKKDG